MKNQELEQGAALIEEALENADTMDAPQARSVLKHAGALALRLIGIQKAATKPAEEEEEGKGDIAGEGADYPADNLDDSATPEGAGEKPETPAEPEVPEAPAGKAEPDGDENGPDKDGGGDGKERKVAKSADAEPGEEGEPEFPAALDVTDILEEFRGIAKSATEELRLARESREREIAKSAADGDAQDARLDRLEQTLDTVLSRLDEVFGITKSIQTDFGSTPVGVAPALAAGDGDEPVGAPPVLNGLDGVASPVQDREVSKAVADPAQPETRCGITQAQFNDNKFLAFDDKELTAKHGLSSAHFQRTIRKSLAEQDEADVALVADYIATRGGK